MHYFRFKCFIAIDLCSLFVYFHSATRPTLCRAARVLDVRPVCCAPFHMWESFLLPRPSNSFLLLPAYSSMIKLCHMVKHRVVEHKLKETTQNLILEYEIDLGKHSKVLKRMGDEVQLYI